MSVIGNGWINCTAFDKAKIIKTKGGSLGFSFQFAINDELDKFGNNVALWMTQTEDEREDKAKRIFMGNGKANWTNGKLTIVTKEEPDGVTMAMVGATPEAPAKAKKAVADDALPF